MWKLSWVYPAQPGSGPAGGASRHQDAETCVQRDKHGKPACVVCVCTLILHLKRQGHRSLYSAAKNVQKAPPPPQLQRPAGPLTSWERGRRKANVRVKSQRDVKTGIKGSHAFFSGAKACEPCTTETPTPALFSSPSSVPSPGATNRFLSHKVDGQVASSSVEFVNWLFWAQFHGRYLFRMWQWRHLSVHMSVRVIIVNEA